MLVLGSVPANMAKPASVRSTGAYLTLAQGGTGGMGRWVVGFFRVEHAFGREINAALRTK